MTIDEYKHRTIELTFPSGLVLVIQPPKVKAMIDISVTITDPIEVLAKLMQLVEARFPDGFTLDDISEPKDWAYLQEWIGRFFQGAVPASLQKSSNSLNSDTLPQDGGPTIS